MAAPDARGRRGRRRRAQPTSRAERRRAAERRRGRFLLVASAFLSAVALVAWFPGSALLHQRQALAATSAQAEQLTRQDRALAGEARRLQSPAEVSRIARERYQLVAPGQQAYQVLPPSGSGASASGGDPGLQPAVAPSAASELPPGSAGVTPTTAAPAGAGGPASDAPPTSLWSRITQTLEFWR